MNSNEQLALIIDTFRQKQSKYRIEEFVLDFLEIWTTIHNKAGKYSLDEAFSFSEELLKSHVIPFYNKFKGQENFGWYDNWIKNYASIVISWEKRGYILFPLNLIVYEICNQNDSVLDFYIQKLKTEEFKGTKFELYKFLVPILVNFAIPLSDIDVMLLKSYQVLESNKTAFFKEPTQKDFAVKMDVSTRTIVRRMNLIRLLQMVQAGYFLDMGKLGYETTLIVHSNKFPDEFGKFLLFSVDLVIGSFSLVQIPYSKPKETLALHEELEVLILNKLTRRVNSWNLSGLRASRDSWTVPPTLLYGRPDISIITPSPRIDFSLEPTFDPFRPLTPADFKILEFLTTKGSFRSVNALSKTIEVSSAEIMKRLKEYDEHQLVIKMNKFYNLGLDLTVTFFISSELDTIPWIQHFLTFPKVDVFASEQSDSKYYFGYLKMPNKWMKPFARQVDMLKQEYNVKFYYKIGSPYDYFKPAISLKNTYS